MDWFFLSLACAFFFSTTDVLSKLLVRDNDEWTVGCAMLGASLPFVVPILIARGLPQFDRQLLVVIAIQIPFEVVAYYLYLTAIRMSPLSLSVPYLSFTPVFTILTAALLLGERVTLQGSMGIVMVVLGAYVLNVDTSTYRPLAPLRAIGKSQGARRMLAVALIWSLTSTLGKQGALFSDPQIYTSIYLICLFAAIAAIELWQFKRHRCRVSFSRKNLLLIALGGVFTALASLTHFQALTLAPVAYMISVKRTSLLFSVLYGVILLREGHLKVRLMGTALMLSGAVILYFTK